jgi:hypothetical protein
MLRQITQREWEIPESRRSYVSRSVVKEWFKRYEASNGNLKSLWPKTRNDKAYYNEVKI